MSKVLVATHEFVRRSMAGPAIRAFELSRQLHAAGHVVRLAVPVSTDLASQPFEIVSYDPERPNDLSKVGIGQDVVVASCGVLPHSPVLRHLVQSIVIDLYDPFHLENLASAAIDPAGGAWAEWSHVIASLDEQLRIGDFFLCASERQRDHWVGALAALNRINPETFRQDASLRSIVDVVAFGISDDPPRRTAPAMRGVIPGIGDDDFVLLWNGGIYNWFDPITLIDSVAQVAERWPRIRLVFLSTSHPNPTVPQMVVAARAQERAAELGLLGRHVFFNKSWVPYEQRADWLLEADVGVSTHFDHAETRYSYRTRILDCFWSGLPVICTASDSLADLIEREDAGITVPPEDVSALVDAIESLISNPEKRRRLGERSRATARSLTWARVTEPLLRFCAAPKPAADLASRPSGLAVPIPLVGDEDRLRRMVCEPSTDATVTPRTREPLHLVLSVSDRGNNFMRELTQYLAVALGPLDASVNVMNGGLPPCHPDVVPIIVAPHEYCHLDPDFQNCDQEALLRRSALVNTEQPGTPWFDLAVSYCARAGLVFDINEDGVAALRERGIEAHHFPLGYHVGIDRWGGADQQERSVDVVFMGDLNDRRSDLLAQYASILARHRFQLFPTDSSAPIRAEGQHFVLGSAKADVLCGAKLLLDIHRGPGSYFAWQRVLPAIANGVVVVTEEASGFAPLRPFEHFVMARYELLPYYVEGLLVDERSRREMADRAYRFVTESMQATAVAPEVSLLLEALAERGRKAPHVATWNGSASAATEALPPQAPRLRAVPSRILPPRDVAPADPVYSQAALLKRVFLTNRQLGRRIEQLERRAEDGSDGRADGTLETTPAWQNGPGEVSVVIPVHNYEAFVDECLESVLASVGVVPEVIVVDDASTDTSTEHVRSFMTRHPELPLALLSLSVNRGLPGTRNEGFRRARSEYVFLLDVDNLVYPRALTRLRDALHTSDAGFAYGIIEWFGDVRALVSKQPWDVSRLVRGNYIDAMSMIRKSTWERVGGYVDTYPETEALYGWEDYDFWLGCADCGIRGEFVAEILARYRNRKHSMISITNLERDTTVELLRTRHPSLPWGAT